MINHTIYLPYSVGGLLAPIVHSPLPVWVDELPTLALLPLFLLVPYLCGSIPFGLLLTRLVGLGDIRKIGSGNIGATNVMRTGNKLLAVLTLLLDAIKGFVPTMAVSLLLWVPDRIADERFVVSYASLQGVAGFCAILGHVYPVWLGFRGGKGVATALGTLLAVNPLLACSMIALWLIVFLFSRISSLSALAAFLGTTVVAAGPALTGREHTYAYLIYMLAVTLLIFRTHRTNIEMLINRQEHRWSTSNE